MLIMKPWRPYFLALCIGFLSLRIGGNVHAMAPGELDPEFGRGGSVPFPSQIFVQADGRIVLANDEPTRPNQPNPRIHRYMPDGTPDPTFDSSALSLTRFFELTGGRAGGFYIRCVLDDQTASPRVIRIHSNGQLDTTFVSEISNGIEAISGMPDGRLIVKTWITPGGPPPPGDRGNQVLRLLADGSLDPSFHIVTNGMFITHLSAEADGKIYLWGQFLKVNGVPRHGIARLHEDGSLDQGFNPVALKWSEGRLPIIDDVRVTPQKKLLVFGMFDSVKGNPRSNLAMLNSDGSLNTGFSPPPVITDYWFGLTQTDGKVVLIGQFEKVGPAVRNSIARLNADGSVDESYLVKLPAGVGARLGAILPNDEVIITGNTAQYFGKVHPGTAHPGPPLLVHPPASQIRVRGQSVTLESTIRSHPPANYQWKFNSRDLPGANEAVLSFTNLDYAQMGSYQLSASNQYGGVMTPPAHLIVNAEPVAPGSLDLTFDPGIGADGMVRRIATQGDRILVIGDFQKYDGSRAEKLARINPNGRIDPSFHTPANYPFMLMALGVDRVQRIYVGGQFCDYNKTKRCSLVRLFPDGEVDTSFAPELEQLTRVFDLALREDGLILIAGLIGDFAPFVDLLDESGKRFPGFARSDETKARYGSTRRLAILPNGAFYAVGLDPERKAGMDLTVRRFHPNGELDTSFEGSRLHSDRISELLASKDGGVWVSSDFSFLKIVGDAESHPSIMHLFPDGSLDARFLKRRGSFTGMGLLPDGDVVVLDASSLRYRPDGSLGTEFKTKIYGVGATAVDSQGRLVVAGQFREVNNVPRQGLARIHTTEQTPDSILWGPFVSATGFTLSLPTVTNRVYTLEATAQLEPANWSTLIQLAGDGNWQGVEDRANDSTVKFYRLRIEPPGVVK